MVEQDFARKLRLALAWRGKTGADLARALDVSPQAVAKFTQGKMMPNSSRLMEIKRFLDVSIDYLISGNDVSGQVEDILSNHPPRVTDRQAMTQDGNA
jgi:transcriptional regulator with XRE-family HTH domain